ncbi:MAG: tryptophan--tRNA ligase, partial [Oscillospiraceae bacterium]
GIQPTGIFTLGNYLGAIKNWAQLQDEYNCTYCIVDMHAITVKQDPVKFRERTLEAYALMLACGVDPKKSTAFIQSHVKTHAELTWILNCNTSFGQLSRMTQFKDKSAKHPDDINAGLFDYPVLMAADILLYQTDLVPVGIDQKQHLELARDIAERFNTTYGNTFKVPEPYIPKETAKIMSLQEPTKKMSKSDDNIKAFISILDEPDTIIKKFRSAVTDSEASVHYADGKDGINNLMSIYRAVTGNTFEQITDEFYGKGYGDFKTAVGEAVANHLAPVRDNFKQYMQDKDYLKACYTEGAQKALRLSQRTVDKAYKKVGFIAL